MENKSEDYKQKEMEELERHVEEINSKIIPDTPGYVRTEGPRRQYRASIKGGMLHLTEI